MALESNPGLCQKPPLFLAAALLAVLASACGVPGLVEGIVEQQGFTIRDEQPQLRPQGGDAVILVLSQEVRDMLRVVSLHLPELAALPAGESAPIEGRDLGRVWLQVAQGTLQSEIRSDGVRVVSTHNARFVLATGGDVSLARVDGLLLGSFRAELEDGGWLEGSFEVAER
jgi:hypothetical protein